MPEVALPSESSTIALGIGFLTFGSLSACSAAWMPLPVAVPPAALQRLDAAAHRSWSAVGGRAIVCAVFENATAPT